MKLLAFLLLLLAPLAAQAQDRPDYAPGQVWEYRTRPQEPESLLRIQQVEGGPDGKPIYHIGVIGVRIPGIPSGMVGHLPVSRETLDASLTRLSPRTGDFPDASDGIAEWRSAHGGVFTAPVADIIDILQKAIAGPN